MPTDWRKETRRAALKSGIDPDIFERQIGAESNFNPNARSPYAIGIAQFTPDTARGLGIDPTDPHQALSGAAGLMASYVKKYGNYEDALVAYNAGPGRVGRPLYSETRNYVSKIMDGHGGGGAAGGTGGGGLSIVDQAHTVNDFDQAGYQDAMRKAIVGRLLATQGQNEHNNPLFKLGIVGTDDPNPLDFTSTRQETVPTIAGSVMRTSPSAQASVRAGTFTIAKGANAPGRDLSGLAKDFISDVAGHSGKPLTVTTGTNHDKLTVNGKISDHFSGNGADFGVPDDSHDGDMLAAHALVAAGVNWNQAVRMARKGGLWSLTPTAGRYKGRRVQVIWKTNEGGNHHNHVHVGIR